MIDLEAEFNAALLLLYYCAGPNGNYEQEGAWVPAGTCSFLLKHIDRIPGADADYLRAQIDDFAADEWPAWAEGWYP